MSHERLKDLVHSVLDARIMHDQILALGKSAHGTCDPYVEFALTTQKKAVRNVEELMVELAMIDAATVLMKENLDEVEKSARQISKIVAASEVMAALGEALPPEEEQKIVDAVTWSGLRLQEMQKIIDLTTARQQGIAALL